jgi:hypothetical protein
MNPLVGSATLLQDVVHVCSRTDGRTKRAHASRVLPLLSPLAHVAIDLYDPAPLSVAWQAHAHIVSRRVVLHRDEHQNFSSSPTSGWFAYLQEHPDRRPVHQPLGELWP